MATTNQSLGCCLILRIRSVADCCSPLSLALTNSSDTASVLYFGAALQLCASVPCFSLQNAVYIYNSGRSSIVGFFAVLFPLSHAFFQLCFSITPVRFASHRFKSANSSVFFFFNFFLLFFIFLAYAAVVVVVVNWQSAGPQSVNWQVFDGRPTCY